MVFNQQDWSDGLPKSTYARYHEEIKLMEMRMGYIGVGKEAMLRAISKVDMSMRDAISKAVELHKSNPGHELNNKYLACVPHLMLYLGTTSLPVASSKRIKLT